LGAKLYTEYVYPFEIAAVLLLVAIIAAIALTLRKRKDSKYQDPSAAVRVKASDRLTMVKVESQKEIFAKDEPLAAPTTEANKGAA
jgi:NADH-quinone oxidoreductase subunit J